MLKYFTILLALLSISVFGQNSQSGQFPPCEVKFQDLEQIEPSMDATLTWANQKSNQTFRIKNYTLGPKSKHYLLEETYQGFPIFHSTFKINTSLEGQILSTFKATATFHNIQGGLPSNGVITEALKNQGLSSWILLEEELGLFPKDSELIYCKRLKITDGIDLFQELFIDQQGNILFSEDLLVYFNENHLFETDTPCNGNIYFPDPLTSSGNSYGGPWADNSNSNSIELASQLFAKEIEGSFSNDSFRLQNSAAVISDVSPPSIRPSVSYTPNFLFTRDLSGFEEVNALFHLTQFNKYIHNELGFPAICDYQIVVDAHAMNGADNSNFNPASSPPRLSFGDGGIDDAEDADVIIHEYGHAISYSAAPNTNSGLERTTLDEAGGDYFASSYSRRISENQWFNVYTWDGHNEFWSGRFSNSSDHYPEDLVNNKYGDADIWSSVLMEIWEDIGYQITDQLLIQANLSYSPNMTMPNAAMLFLQADELWYNSAHFQSIRNHMVARGLLPEDVGINSLEKSNDIRIIGSFEFQQGNENLLLVSPTQSKVPIYLYTIEGKLLHTFYFKNGQLELSPSMINPGCYVLVFEGKSKRIIR